MKLKPGTTIELGNKKYRVTRAKNKFIRCRVCQEHNKCIPCFDPDPHVDSKSHWSKGICDSKLPENCYMYPL